MPRASLCVARLSLTAKGNCILEIKRFIYSVAISGKKDNLEKSAFLFLCSTRPFVHFSKMTEEWREKFWGTSSYLDLSPLTLSARLEDTLSAGLEAPSGRAPDDGQPELAADAPSESTLRRLGYR